MADQVPGRILFVLLFILGSVVVMFYDGLVFDNYNSRPSMAMMHMDMKPVIYNDPAPPGLDEYWAQFKLTESLPSDPDVPMQPEIVIEDGLPIKVYHITMRNVLHEIRPGKKLPMFSFNGQIPAPTLRVNEGDRVRVIFTNEGTDPHTIHWHGINNISFLHDGVPDVTQEPVLPGQVFTYEFTAGPSGTKMYHCHVEAPHHILMGMYGALIVDPAPQAGGAEQGNPFGPMTDREYTLLLSEMDGEHAHMLMPGDMMPMGPDGDLPWLISPGRKFMMPFEPGITEFLINGKSFPSNRPIMVKEGDIVRMRLVNLALEPVSIHIHGHEFTVTHRDGFLLAEPFKVDTLMVGPAERYDVWFEANNPGMWMLHEHGMANMANGYEPAGIMAVILYEGQSTEPFEAFLRRVQVYQDNIEHMDEDHGKLTPSTPVGVGMDMGGGMAGMDMGGGGH